MLTTDEDVRAASALRTRREEFDAALTHGVGAIIAAIASVYLIGQAVVCGDIWCCFGCVLYAIALLGVLGSSTLSHLHLPEHLNRRFRAYDQGFIYLLAVGSLSPFALVFLRTPAWMGFYFFSLGLALTGFISKVVFEHKVDKISLWFYLVVGWCQAIALIPLAKTLPSNAMSWIFAGAACYCVGVVFLVLDKRQFRFHAIWHLMVLAACSCHYYAILKFVVQSA